MKLPTWLFLTLGPFVLDLIFTPSGSTSSLVRTTVPLWAWIIYWLVAILLQFAIGVGYVVRELKTKLDERKAQLKGQVEWHRLGRLDNGARVLLAALRIDNRGADTKVSNWRVVTKPGTREQNKPVIDEPEVVVTTDDGYRIRCLMSQYLPFVLNTNPIGKTYRQGFAVFNVNVEPSDCEDVTYTFRDQDGTLFDAKRLITDGGEIKSFPPELTCHVTQLTSGMGVTPPGRRKDKKRA